jgi:hypothetical protein
MGDILTCADIKKAVKILNENQIELPHVLVVSEHWLKRKEIVDYAKWGAKTRRFSTYFVDKNQKPIKSFIMDKIN